MLTERELNQIKGLLHHLNHTLSDGEIKPDDIKMIDANGDEAALIGYDAGVDAYVLKQVQP